jgi:D-alanyl-D-alanine carboxypeptidase (penicillin-binding protein 5/6)
VALANAGTVLESRGMRLATTILGGFSGIGRRARAAACCGLLAWSVLASGLAFAANQSVQGAKKEEGGYETDAPNAILIDGDSGSVLFEKNADQPTAPSTMQQLMTTLVVFDKLASGEIQPTEEYVVSENAWRHGGAPSHGPTMFAAIHSRVAVQDLLRGVAILNANDGSIALGEGIAGNEHAFAALMEQRARDIGLTDSTFANASGLPDLANQMSVRDLARLARFIIKTYPEQYKLFNERDFTWNKIHQTNRNPLLNALTSADGVKNGYSKDAGNGMVGSAVQSGVRLIVAVNGIEDSDDCLTEAKKLLEWGFRNFEVRSLFEAGQIVGYAKVFGGGSSSVALTSHDPVKVMVQKNGQDKLLARIIYTGPVRAPIDRDQRIGAIRVWRGKELAVEVPVYATESIGPGSMTRRAIDSASELLIGWVRSGVGKL